jgi:hypothetical protein
MTQGLVAWLKSLPTKHKALSLNPSTAKKKKCINLCKNFWKSDGEHFSNVTVWHMMQKFQLGKHLRNALCTYEMHVKECSKQHYS